MASASCPFRRLADNLAQVIEKLKDKPLTKNQSDMAKMSRGGSTDKQIAKSLELSSSELAAEWKALAKVVSAGSREEAVEIVIARLLEEARAALAEERAELALVLKTPEEIAILTMNSLGMITGVSRGCDEALGCDLEKMIGRPVDSFLKGRAKGTQQSADEMERADRGERVRSVRTHRRADGTEFEGQHTVVAVLGPQGEVSGFVRYIQDLTQRRIHEVRIKDLEMSIALLVDP